MAPLPSLGVPDLATAYALAQTSRYRCTLPEGHEGLHHAIGEAIGRTVETILTEELRHPHLALARAHVEAELASIGVTAYGSLADQPLGQFLVGLRLAAHDGPLYCPICGYKCLNFSFADYKWACFGACNP